MNFQSILVIGSTGRTGIHFIQQLAAGSRGESKPDIYAFCRDPKKMDYDTSILCSGIIQGDAKNPDDIKRAIDLSKADLVMVAIGSGDNIGKSTIRTKSAQALVDVLARRGYEHVKVLNVSSTGAGGTPIIFGFGIGKMIEYHLRHVFRDHDGQEAAFKKSIQDRLLIVRPTSLTDGKPTKKGKIVLFDAFKKYPSMAIDRKDLTEWIVNNVIYGNTGYFGKSINITCV